MAILTFTVVAALKSMASDASKVVSRAEADGVVIPRKMVASSVEELRFSDPHLMEDVCFG